MPIISATPRTRHQQSQLAAKQAKLARAAAKTGKPAVADTLPPAKPYLTAAEKAARPFGYGIPTDVTVETVETIFVEAPVAEYKPFIPGNLGEIERKMTTAACETQCRLGRTLGILVPARPKKPAVVRPALPIWPFPAPVVVAQPVAPTNRIIRCYDEYGNSYKFNGITDEVRAEAAQMLASEADEQAEAMRDSQRAMEERDAWDAIEAADRRQIERAIYEVERAAAYGW